MKKMKNVVSKAGLALAIGAGAIGTVGHVAPMQAHAADIPEVTVDKTGKVNTGTLKKGDMSKSWTTLIGKYRFWIAGFSGIAAVSMILFFILNFMKLGASAGNPSARSQALSGLIWTGLAAAGLGAVSVIVGFFYSALL